MTTKKAIREILVDPDTKARIENAAYMDRTNVSTLVRELLLEIVAGDHEDILSVADGNEPENGRARIGLLVPDQLWEAAADVAWRMHLTRSAMVRIVAAYKYRDVPADRAKVNR